MLFIFSTLKHASNAIFIARFAPIVISTAALGWMFWPAGDDETETDRPAAQSADEADEQPASDSVFQSPHYLIGWFVFALLWPIALIPVIKAVTKHERNGFNLLMLVALTAVPLALAYPVAFGNAYAWWKGLLWAISLVAVFLWCTWIMSRTIELAK